ncbi:MAG: helix-turn-helix domain-containing protein [Chloroflexi bacterium]|nr:helix-turn-helix domain-containing protein [Chloroflexota bacterium]
MHYEQNLDQEDIANRLGVSRATISRALKEARERGYIRTIVVPPPERAGFLESALRERFRLSFVAITPSRTDINEAIQLVAQVAAAYLDRNVPGRGILGVAGGRTVLSIAKQLRPGVREDLKIIPLMGGWVGQNAISASEVAREMAIRWNAQAKSLFAPAFVKDEIARQALLREASISHALEEGKRADIACIGIAAVSLQTRGTGEYVSGSGRIEEEDVRQLLVEGAAGETCAQFFNEKGVPIESWNQAKTIAVPLENLCAMKDVLAVGAEPEKALAFLGALKMGIIKSLIISEDLAAELDRLDTAD